MVGIAFEIAGDIAVDTVVDDGVESLGVTISCVRWAGCSSTITVAAATASGGRQSQARRSAGARVLETDPASTTTSGARPCMVPAGPRRS